MEDYYGYVYLTTNLVNGKMYIGQHHFNEYDKWYLGSGKLLQQAIKKYGRDNFEKVIIEYAKNLDELNQREKYWIDYVGANMDMNHTTWYNIAEGGLNPPVIYGHKHSEETKKKMALAATGKKKSRESIEKGINTRRLRGMTPKEKAQLDFLHTLKPMKGKHHSEESKKKMSEVKKGKHLGENSFQHVLTDKEVLSIVQDRKDGMSYIGIAKKYNVSKGCVNHILNGRAWSWLTKIKTKE